MKKIFVCLAVAAMCLSAFVFTSCNEPKEYEGNYYHTEYLPDITATEYNEKFNNQSVINKALYRKTWASRTGFEKKTNLTDSALIAYIKSKASITDQEIKTDVIAYLDNSNYGFNMTIRDPDSNTYYLMYIYSADPVGTPTEFSFINPTDKNIEIYDVNNELQATIAAGSSATENLYLDYTYYYMDGSDAVGIYYQPTDPNPNCVLGLNRPVAGKKYICLSQYKKAELEQSEFYTDAYLYEIVDEDNEYAYKYGDVYICSFPSLAFSITYSGFVTDILGKEVTYSEDFFSPYSITNQSWSRGWQTCKNDKWYNHFIKYYSLKMN